MKASSSLIKAFVLVIALLFTMPLFAAPAQIIILRHGEKRNEFDLCATGKLRSKALTEYYLGQGAKSSLFTLSPPAAFFAITLHTLEFIGPIAGTWKMPVIAYVVQASHKSPSALTQSLNQQTQELAKGLFENPYWNGKTVVLSWEHFHIANAELEKSFPNQEVTLRQLLKLDTLKDPKVPKTWPDSNYDYFWIIHYNADGLPEKFEVVQQIFGSAYPKVPTNKWGEPEPSSILSKCIP